MSIFDEIIHDVNLGKIPVKMRNSTDSTFSDFTTLESHENTKKSQPESTFHVSLYVFGVDFLANEKTNRKTKHVKKLKRFSFMQKADRDNVKAIEKALDYAIGQLDNYPLVFVSEDANKVTAHQNYKFE